ncbi:hypothetical protein [Idiomarina piscisalsi]|uniref:Uncharacterized protein n=1 Tax=Idiomarina piscisalsi TaxID=1096243 RepID=A0A432YXI3_9GAMM|nr:hypothetical protein [Idiomarina piscisalsi]RUO68011.1 hypothetical protein CWI73_03905 [Idiomarina piscisalsi]
MLKCVKLALEIKDRAFKAATAAEIRKKYFESDYQSLTPTTSKPKSEDLDYDPSFYRLKPALKFAVRHYLEQLEEHDVCVDYLTEKLHSKGLKPDPHFIAPGIDTPRLTCSQKQLQVRCEIVEFKRYN